MDQILFWNDVALEADRTTHTTGDAAELMSQGPAGSTRALAIVHLAMHDALFGINRKQEPYLGSLLPTVPAGADPDAAIAAAAHASLTALYPTQKLFFIARQDAAGLGSGPAVDQGHAFGLKVAEAMLALRADDPGLGDDGYAASAAIGHHQGDPDNPESPDDPLVLRGFYAPFFGARSRNFAATVRHHLDAPPAVGSPTYERALRLVRSKGIAPQLAGTLPADLLPTRTGPEMAIGLFWAYDKAMRIGSPPRLYNQIVRQIAMSRSNDVHQNARLFALVNAAQADAAIVAWADKYFYDLWRPVVGIRQHEPDPDPGWLPLGSPNTNNPGHKNRTPGFPAYPSGHATIGAATFQTVRRFYGQGTFGPDTLADGIAFVSDELNGINVDNTGAVRPRLEFRFPRGLWQMIEENARSRIFLGVHWIFDAFGSSESGEMDLTQNIGGVPLGLNVAEDIAAHGLKASAAARPNC